MMTVKGNRIDSRIALSHAQPSGEGFTWELPASPSVAGRTIAKFTNVEAQFSPAIGMVVSVVASCHYVIPGIDLGH